MVRRGPLWNNSLRCWPPPALQIKVKRRAAAAA
jgi:hypothetical protein